MIENVLPVLVYFTMFFPLKIEKVNWRYVNLEQIVGSNIFCSFSINQLVEVCFPVNVDCLRKFCIPHWQVPLSVIRERFALVVGTGATF